MSSADDVVKVDTEVSANGVNEIEISQTAISVPEKQEAQSSKNMESDEIAGPDQRDSDKNGQDVDVNNIDGQASNGLPESEALNASEESPDNAESKNTMSSHVDAKSDTDDDSSSYETGSATDSDDSDREQNDKKKDTAGLNEREDEMAPRNGVSSTPANKESGTIAPVGNHANETPEEAIQGSEITKPLSAEIEEETIMEKGTPASDAKVETDTGAKKMDDVTEFDNDKQTDDGTVDGEASTEHVQATDETDTDKSPQSKPELDTDPSQIPSDEQVENNEKDSEIVANNDMNNLGGRSIDNQAEPNNDTNGKSDDDTTSNVPNNDIVKGEKSDSETTDKDDSQGLNENQTDNLIESTSSTKPDTMSPESSADSSDNTNEKKTDSTLDANEDSAMEDRVDVTNQENGQSCADKNDDTSALEEAKPITNKENMESEKTEENDEEGTDAEEKPTEIPECEKVKRNFDIEECFPVLGNIGMTFSELLLKVKSVTQAYSWRISNHELRDFVTDLREYNDDFTSIKEAYQKCEEFIHTFSHDLKDLRQSMDEMNALIGKKYRSEGLSSWLEVDDATIQGEYLVSLSFI